MKKMMICTCLFVLAMSVTCNAFAWVTPTQANWITMNDVQCVNTQDIEYWDGYSNGSSGPDQDFVNIPYKCVETNNPYYDQVGILNTSGRLYIYHRITGGGGNEYTNLFHAVRLENNLTDSDGFPSMYGYLCGQKWVTPQMWIPIQSNAIRDDRLYSVAVRGNTKHYENYGATSVDFTIGIEANQ